MMRKRVSRWERGSGKTKVEVDVWEVRDLEVGDGLLLLSWFGV
jgi:hypothetical protein